MTPNQIATNFALVAMADMDDPQQAKAAINIMTKTIPALRDALSAQFELAGCSQETIFNGFVDHFKAALSLAGVVDAAEEISDDDILSDEVMDEDEVDDEQLDIVESSLTNSVQQLRELAMVQMQIRDKGKFIPLDDIELPKGTKAATKAIAAAPRGKPVVEEERKPIRRNVMGSLRK